MVPQGAVLIVDDDTATRDAFAEVLKDEGYRTIQAADGAAALAALRDPANAIGIVLLDYAMPVMSGAELIAEKVKDPAIRDVPVILMSGFGKDEIDVQGGIVATVSKGVDVGVWLGMVKKLCRPEPRRDG